MSMVKFFRSTDFGAPQLFGAAGGLLTVLDACLVNGYGQQNIASMTHLNNVVTVNTVSSHNLSSFSRQTIAGANEAGYNGDHVITVYNSTQFTFIVQPGAITVDTATGTMTTKTGSAGWTKPFSGTNIGVYRTGGGLQHYYRINDTTTIAARFVGYTSMTDVNTGTDQFPSTALLSGGSYWQKSTTTDGTNARAWIIIADDKTLHYWVNYSAAFDYSSLAMLSIGEFTPVNAGDLFASVIAGNNAQSSYSAMLFGLLMTSVGLVLTSTNTNTYAARSYNQIAVSPVIGKVADYSKNAQSYMGYGGLLPFPHPVDGGLYQCPIMLVEGGTTGASSVIRGTMRGLANPLHNTPLSHLDIFEGNGDLLGKTFLVLTFCPGGAYLGQVFVDISEEWS